MKVKCIVIDDEAIARELITEYVAKIPELEMVGAYSNALNAGNMIRKDIVDLLFLDIEMPSMNGVDFLNSLQYKPHIILTTAYSDYAIKSYEIGVLDYLLKPIEFSRFYLAVNKIFSLNSNNSIRSDFNLPKPKETQNIEEDHLFIKSGNKVVKIVFKDIQYITSKGAYIQIILTSGQKIMALQSMNRMEEVLPSKYFFRVHRSHIVNITHVNAIEGNIIKLDKDKEIVLSKSKREVFLQRIDKNNMLT